jgi:hypothetical protein
MTKEVDKLKTKSDRELSQVYSNIQSILDRKR